MSPAKGQNLNCALSTDILLLTFLWFHGINERLLESQKVDLSAHAENLSVRVDKITAGK